MRTKRSTSKSSLSSYARKSPSQKCLYVRDANEGGSVSLWLKFWVRSGPNKVKPWSVTANLGSQTNGRGKARAPISHGNKTPLRHKDLIKCTHLKEVSHLWSSGLISVTTVSLERISKALIQSPISPAVQKEVAAGVVHLVQTTKSRYLSNLSHHAKKSCRLLCSKDRCFQHPFVSPTLKHRKWVLQIWLGAE